MQDYPRDSSVCFDISGVKDCDGTSVIDAVITGQLLETDYTTAISTSVIGTADGVGGYEVIFPDNISPGIGTNRYGVMKITLGQAGNNDFQTIFWIPVEFVYRTR